jgi:hypothetical protein
VASSYRDKDRRAAKAPHDIEEKIGSSSFPPVLQFPTEGETGAVDSFFILIPLLLIATTLLALFQYGVSQNELTSRAILVGRELARYSDTEDFTAFTQEIISRDNLGVTDFHVLRYPIGNRTFIQLVLVGKPVPIGWTRVTPSARSLTLVD